MTSPPAASRTLLADLVHQRYWTVEDFVDEFAKAARALPKSATTHKKMTEIGDRQAKRWLAGTVSLPRPSACRVLEHMFGRPVAELLRPPPVPPVPPTTEPATPITDTAPRPPEPAAYQPDYGPALSSARQFPAYAEREAGRTGVPHDAGAPGGLSLMAADDAARFLAHAQAADGGPDAVSLLHNEVRRISQAFVVDGGPALLLPGLAAAQRFVFRCLDGPAEPDHTSDLYFLAGVIGGLLAQAGLDIGQFDAALTQTRTALLCADRAGHPGLKVWLRNEQSSVARWAGWHHESLRYAQLAAADAATTRSTPAVGRAVREARAHAAVGDADKAHTAITAAAEAREHLRPDELDDIGGFVTFVPARGSVVVADALSMLSDHAAAERAAAEALAELEKVPAYEIDQVNARVLHALARARRSNLEGAQEALRPVLALPPERRIHGIVANLQRVYTALSDQRYHGSSTARDTATEIEAFSQIPAQGGTFPE